MSAFNQGIVWCIAQLLAADQPEAADTLFTASGITVAEAQALQQAVVAEPVVLFRTITRVADDGRAVVVRG